MELRLAMVVKRIAKGIAMIIVQSYLTEHENDQTCFGVMEQRLQIAKKNISLAKVRVFPDERP